MHIITQQQSKYASQPYFAIQKIEPTINAMPNRTPTTIFTISSPFFDEDGVELVYPIVNRWWSLVFIFLNNFVELTSRFNDRLSMFLS
jgi:hypothetical protein